MDSYNIYFIIDTVGNRPCFHLTFVTFLIVLLSGCTQNKDGVLLTNFSRNSIDIFPDEDTQKESILQRCELIKDWFERYGCIVKVVKNISHDNECEVFRSQKDRDNCYFSFSIEKKYLSSCDKIKNKTELYQCYAFLGAIKNDTKICAQFNEKTDRDWCNFYFNKNWGTSVKEAGFEDDLCEKIEDNDIRALCHIPSLEPKERIDEFSKLSSVFDYNKLCRDYSYEQYFYECIFGVAIAKNDKSICDNMKDINISVNQEYWIYRCKKNFQ